MRDSVRDFLFEEINFISMAAYKTNKPIMIPLNDVAWNILKKYEFVLPSITEQHYNREIKKLLRLSGISTTFEWQTYDDNGRKILKSKFLYEIFTNHCCSRTAIIYFFSRIYTRSSGENCWQIIGYNYGLLL